MFPNAESNFSGQFENQDPKISLGRRLGGLIAEHERYPITPTDDLPWISRGQPEFTQETDLQRFQDVSLLDVLRVIVLCVHKKTYIFHNMKPQKLFI